MQVAIANQLPDAGADASFSLVDRGGADVNQLPTSEQKIPALQKRLDIASEATCSADAGMPNLKSGRSALSSVMPSARQVGCRY